MSIFSTVKDELKSVLDTHLTNSSIVQEVRGYRSFTFKDVSPLLILTVNGYGYRESDGASEVDIMLVTVVRFSGESEEETAEQVLDDIEEAIIDLFNPDDGTYQTHPGYWGAVDFYQRSERPTSPLEPGIRYARKHLRFIV